VKTTCPAAHLVMNAKRSVLLFGNVSFGTNNGHPRARFPAAPPPRSGMGEARGGAPAARGDSLAALAADAARGLASCRARAAALRARLDGSLRASGLVEGGAGVASQHAALTRRAAGLSGDVSGEARDAVDACEAHLKRGETGGALAAYARLARAALLRDAASSGPARLDGAVAIRAERCRAALSERLAASLDRCDARGPDENAAERTALALGGLYWLDRDPDEWFRRDDRSAAPAPEGGWRGVHRVAAKKTRLDRLATRDAETRPAAAFKTTKQHERATSEAKGPSGPSLEAPHPSANLEEEEDHPRVLEEDSPSSAFSAAGSLRRDLDAAARDAASLLAALDAAPAPPPPPETVCASVAAPAAAALGAALDALIARIDRDGGFEATGPHDRHPRSDRRRVDDADARADATDARRASGALVALARAADEYVANAAAGLAATPDSKRGSLRRTNPTRTTRAGAASLVSASFSATLDARLARLESALARSRAAAPALRALAAAGPSALAERFLRAGALEPHHKLEPSCAAAVAEANHALPTETTARCSVGRRTSPRKSMSIPPLEPRVRSVVARALAARVGALVADALGAAFGREAMTRRAACVAANTARAAARAIRRAEAEEMEKAEMEKAEGEAVADERTRRTKTALATARRLEALASRADSAAASAASRPAATALEGGAAQAWRFRRKPDSIATAPRCSPAIVHWRRCVARGVLALDREAAASFGSARARLLDAFASTAAAEAAATTLRIAPSRARRDAFAWDCRAIASTLAALDRVVRDAVLRDEDEDEDERGEGEDERGEARTRSDEARRTVGSSRVLAATSRALVRRAALLLAPADDVRAALPEIARLAVSGVTLATPGDDDRGVGSFGSFDEERAAHLSTLAESAFGRAPSPESLWDPRDPAWDRPPPSDEWAWIPRDDPARTAASLLDGDRVITGDGDERLSKTPAHSAPWPCPREAREAHEALERSWREAEAAQAARASAEERWAALAARSELADDDQTPLDEEEEAERKALRDAVAAAAAARAGGGGGETRPAGAVKKPSASASGP